MGKPALFTECRLDRTTVPEGVYRYELRHADEDWGEIVTLSRSIVVNYYGSVLTREPFQLPVEGWIPLESNSLSFRDGDCRTLAEFQEKYPGSKKDVIDFYSVNDESLHDLYFSRSEEQDKVVGSVGHLRGDFGSGSRLKRRIGNSRKMTGFRLKRGQSREDKYIFRRWKDWMYAIRPIMLTISPKLGILWTN